MRLVRMRSEPSVLVLTTDLRAAIGFSSFGVLVYYAVANASAWTQDREHRRWPRWLNVLGGAACVAVTHDLNLALAYATRVVIIADGRVAFDACTAEALRTPDWLPLFSLRLRLSGSWVSYA